MTKRRGGLGKGLDALLPEPVDDVDAATLAHPASIAVELLVPGPEQPRRHLREDSLDELAQSIRAQGIIEPLIVRPRAAGGYQIIAGERRWRAAQRAGLAMVPAIVRDVDDRQAMAIALIENIQREALNPLEEARALKRLLEEYAITHEALAAAVGKSRAAVSNLLRLLNLSPAVRDALDAGALEMGHARALLALPEADQAAAARRVVAQHLSVRQTEALVKRLLHRQPAAKPAPNPDTRRLERLLSERLGARTSITNNKRGTGRIVIHYANLDQLDGLLARLGADSDD